MLLSPAVSRDVFCQIKMCEPHICVFNETVENDKYVLRSELDKVVERFETRNNLNVKHLPQNIAKQFPNMKSVTVVSCALTIVRDIYFINMRRLESLTLDKNKIATIEPRAFLDLFNVESLSIKGNLIQTLHENVFKTMAKLERLFLNNNQVKFLSPATLEIPDGRLHFLDLSGNVCIDDYYHGDGPNAKHLEAHLINKCTQGKVDRDSKRF